jgi:major type 1 subunit fimbrin (pilin)
MKSIFPAIVLATGGLLGLASFATHAADGTVAVGGSVVDTTCSISVNGSGPNATVALPPVSTGSLKVNPSSAGTTPFTIALSNCSGVATKAIAQFEGNEAYITGAGALVNYGTAFRVYVRLLNAQRQPIDLNTGGNNQIGINAVTISGGAANLQYFAEYYAPGGAGAGTVQAYAQYTMQYQ